jgi:hypothetical protein
MKRSSILVVATAVKMVVLVIACAPANNNSSNPTGSPSNSTAAQTWSSKEIREALDAAEDLYPTSKNGFVIVKKDGHYGVMDSSGKLVVPVQYDDLAEMPDMEIPSSSLLIPAKKGGKFGYLDLKGNVVVPFDYDSATNFYSGGVAVVYKGRERRVINSSGKVLASSADGRGAEVLFGAGLVRVEKDGHSGMIDHNGNVVLSAEYDQVIFPSAADEIGALARGHRMLILVKKENRYGYVDLNGKVIIPPKYDEGTPFIPSGLAQARIGNRTILLGDDGREILNLDVDSFLGAMSENGYIRVQNSPAQGMVSIGIVDRDGNEIVPAKYEKVGDPFGAVSQLISVQDKGLVGYYDMKTRQNVIPPSFEEGSEFNKNGTAYVKKDGKFHLIDASGKMIADVDADAMGAYLSQSIFLIKKENQYGLMDSNGKVIAAPQYASIQEPQVTADDAPLLRVSKGNLIGYLNFNGDVVVAPQYVANSKSSGIFKKGDSYVKVTKKGHVSYLDRNGKETNPSDVVPQLMKKK